MVSIFYHCSFLHFNFKTCSIDLSLDSLFLFVCFCQASGNDMPGGSGSGAQGLASRSQSSSYPSMGEQCLIELE